MPFNPLGFAIFLPIVFVLYRLIPEQHTKLYLAAARSRNQFTSVGVYMLFGISWESNCKPPQVGLFGYCFAQPNIARITLWMVLLILRSRTDGCYNLYGGTTRSIATAPLISSRRWNGTLGWMLKYWWRVNRFLRKLKQKGRSAGVGRHEIGRGQRGDVKPR